MFKISLSVMFNLKFMVYLRLRTKVKVFGFNISVLIRY